MNRENAVFTVCGFALGLVIGSFLIGPHLSHPSLGASGGVANAAEPVAAPAPAMEQMNNVRQQLASLKQTIERDPRNSDALVQLGTLYMEAGKFPQAAGYFERALAVREDPNVRTALGICNKQMGQAQ